MLHTNIERLLEATLVGQRFPISFLVFIELKSKVVSPTELHSGDSTQNDGIISR